MLSFRDSNAPPISLATWIILVLSTIFLARLVLKLILRRAFKSWRIGSLGWFSLLDIKWRDVKGARVNIASVSWNFAGAGCARGGGRSWFVLRIEGVKVWLPKSLLQASEKERSKREKIKPSPASSRRSSISSNSNVEHSSSSTWLHQLGTSTFSALFVWIYKVIIILLSHITIEIKIQVELEDTFTAKTTFRAGGNLRSSLNSKIEAWVGLEGLSISEIPKKNSTRKPFPAVEVQSVLLLTASAPIDSSIGMDRIFSTKGACLGITKSSVEIGIEFPEALKGIQIRMVELQRLCASLPAPRNQDSNLDDSKSTPNSISYLRTLSITLPLLIVSAHYDTPPELLNFAASRPLPESATFTLRILDVQGILELGGKTDDNSCVHRDYLGKARALNIQAKLGFSKIEGKVKVDKNDVTVTGQSPAFEIGASSITLTSTWLPPSLAAILSPPSLISSHFPEPRNLNEESIITEIVIGHLSTHATFETLDSALTILSIRPSYSPRSPTTIKECPTILTNLPRVVGSITCIGVDLKITGPKIVSSQETKEGLDRFFENWNEKDAICVTIPTISMAWGGEYVERSLVRSEMDRRLARRSDKRASIQEVIPEEGTEDVEPLTEDVFGKIPVLGKINPIRIVPKRPLSKPIDQYSLEYVYRFNLTGSHLNAFIAASDPTTLDSPDSSEPTRIDVFMIGPVELTATGKILGSEVESSKELLWESHKGETSVLIEKVEIDLWQPQIISCIRDFLRSFAIAKELSSLNSNSLPRRPSQLVHQSLIDSLARDFSVYIAIASSDVRIAGSDTAMGDKISRGVSLHSGPIIFEYVLQKLLVVSTHSPDRLNLMLREELSMESNDAIADTPTPLKALVKITATDLHIDPVEDARKSSGRTTKKEVIGKKVDEVSDDWELKNRAFINNSSPGRRGSILPSRIVTQSDGIANIPQLDIRVKIQAAMPSIETKALDEITFTIDAPRISLRLDVFHSYLCLLAVSTLLSILPPSASSKTKSSSSRPAPIINSRTDVADFNLFLTLPNDVRLFSHIQRLRVRASPSIGLIISLDSFLLAGVSPTAPGKWDDIIRLKNTSCELRPDPQLDGRKKFIVVIDLNSARLRIPFRYVFAQIVDNAATFVKVLKQLVYVLIKGGTGSILNPEPEGPKDLPKIEINAKMFAIEIQDDPFETRLNIIWRAGYEEQIARRDRQDAFDAKVEAIRKMEAGEEEAEEVGVENGVKLGSNPRNGKPNGRHSIGIEEAEHDLRAYNSTNWVKRMRNAVAEQGRREEALTRTLYGPRHNNQRPDSLLPVDMLPMSRSSPLARITLSDINLWITPPSFSKEELPQFMHDVGKGLPLDTKFTLLVPLHLSWKMEEARCQIRDYPLPLLHIPPMSAGVGNDFASWELETDFVLGEEVGGKESIRKATCEIVPRNILPLDSEPYTLTIPRTAMTVKSYATPIVTIRSPFATRIGWGNSIQPAIQSIAKVLDTLTKASPDPSDRVGFWDKIRLQLHWRIQVLFQGEGPVHFHIKGTRDPYALTGFGAGFSKAWRGNVKFLVGLDNDDKEFIQVESEEYILGIPNLRDYVDNAATGIARDPTENDDRSTQYSTDTGGAHGRNRFRQEADFIKVCAKFINGVRWGVGMALERACTRYDCENPGCKDRTAFNRQCRKFEFIPHWEVKTKTSAAALGEDGLVIDSFAGFRSDFIHFSISLTSPLTLSLPSNSRSPESPTEGSGYNSLHLSPQASTHFWAWWKLFDGSMSLPIRQGKLFPSAQAPAKKFGKHCATIKYRFSLAPLFISHTYRQDNWNEWSKGETTVVGLKGKIGRFNVDLHQREQEETVLKPALGTKKTLMKKVFYQAEVDCDELDLRVISAIFSEPEKRAMAPEVDEDEDQEANHNASNENHEVADEDLEWIDLDDFVDAIYTIPDQNPRMRVLPFINCPRLNYYRKIDVEKESGEGEEVQSNTKFGNEDSHTCLMGCAKDTFGVQIDAAQARLAELEAEALKPSSSQQGSKAEAESRIQAMHRIITRLTQLRDANLSPNSSGRTRSDDQPYARMPSTAGMEAEDQADDAHLPHINSTLYEEWGGWANRYMIHNPSIQVNNTTRDVLLKYYYSSRERKGFVYHLSASAIRFIRDLKKEHDKKSRRSWARRKSTRTGAAPSRRKSVWDETQNTNRLLDDLVNGGSDSWAAGESEGSRKSFGDALDVDPESAADSLPEFFDLRSSHLCMFIKPQISLQSDMDDKSTIILTAFRAQLKIYDVVDLKIMDDPVNSHVLHQTFGTLDGLQAFYPKSQNTSKTGTSFVPLETLVDLRAEPWGFDRVVPRTSAAVRYDKFNRLRIGSTRSSSGPDLGSNGNSTNYFDSGTDRVSVECTKFSVSANPNHFAAIFNVVTDLLLYSDPIRVSQNKKLEEVVFTRDFSDLGEISKIVINLQQRIRILVDLGQQYQVHLEELDDEGRLELFYARAEFLNLSSELNLVLQAITRAQDVNGGSVKKGASKAAGIQFEARASELVWHMLDGKDTPFAKFSVNGVEFSWISKQDSSVSNRLVIKDLSALNSSPDHVFAEIISKHEQSSGHELAKANVFAAILWNALAPVGGISIVEQFELHLHPIRLQLEHSIGLKIMDYVFSQRRKKEAILPKQEKSLKSSRSSSLLVPLNNSFNRSSESLSNSRPSSTRSSTPSIFEEDSPISSFVTSASSRSKRTNPDAILPIVTQEGGLNAEEMRLRASLNRTFILVDITATVLCLTYRSEKSDSSPLPDIYNIVYNTPSIQYRSKTWSFLDMLNELKKDVIKATWSQKGALLGQLLKNRKLPILEVRKAAKLGGIMNKFLPKSIGNGSASASSGQGEGLGSPLRLSLSGASTITDGGRSVSPVESRPARQKLTIQTNLMEDDHDEKARMLLGKSY